VRRRDLLPALGASLLAARAVRAENERVRKVGVLMNGTLSLPVPRQNLEIFTTALAELGWTEGRNLHLEVRWGGADGGAYVSGAAELAATKPEVLLASTSPAVHALREPAGGIPIVFVVVTDPAGPGVVKNLARPEGFITGFSNYDAPMASKWLGLLKEIDPGLRRVAPIYNLSTASYAPLLVDALRAAAPALGVAVMEGAVETKEQAGTLIETLGRAPGGGLILLPDSWAINYRAPIMAAAAREKVPVVYPYTYIVREGGLAAYGIVLSDLYRRAAGYIDRILKGAKPADLPVQAPVRFDFALNLKTAKALGITFPPMLLARADEVVE
jgi:putative ABC transport system substrate-binding protein